MITETLQPINCFISTKNEILHERTAPVLGRGVSARARASRTTYVNGIAALALFIACQAIRLQRLASSK